MRKLLGPVSFAVMCKLQIVRTNATIMIYGGIQ